MEVLVLATGSTTAAVVELAAAAVGFVFVLLFCTVEAAAFPWWFALVFLVTVTEGPGAVLSASNLVALVALFALLLFEWYLEIATWGLTIFSVNGDAVEPDAEEEAGERKPLESS